MKMKSCNSTTTAETEADQDLLLGIEQVWTSTECGGKTLTQPQICLTISFLLLIHINKHTALDKSEAQN